MSEENYGPTGLSDETEENKEVNFGICTDEDVLRQISKETTKEYVEALGLWDKLTQANLKTPNGIGLAAIQLGEPIRAAVLVDRRGNEPVVYRLLNPVIIKRTKPKRVSESCLSVPGKSFLRTRYMHIVVKNDLSEQPIEYDNLWAQALQHEIDHMDGKLVMDGALDVHNNVTAKKNKITKSRKKRSKQKKSRQKNRRK